MQLRLQGLKTLPEVRQGDDLSAMIREAVAREGRRLLDSTIVVVAQKVVSKSEGALVDLETIEPSPLSADWAVQWGKDPRAIEIVLREATRIVRMDRGVIVAQTRHGFITANAGVDLSNSSGKTRAVLLPRDPDASAHSLRAALGCGAVIISDTFGRPWREGLVNVAIGVSGMDAVEDLRGTCDRDGRPLSATILARADEMAGAAGLLMPKAGGVPVVLIDGYSWDRRDGTARSLLRAPDMDLFR